MHHGRLYFYFLFSTVLLFHAVHSHIICQFNTKIAQIDVKGTTGKKTEFQSILWKCVRMFSLETAGRFDKDSELTLFTNINGMTRLNIDFRKGKADIFAIQSFFANKLLGMDTADPSESAKSAKHGFFGGSGGGLSSMFGDNNSTIDAKKADAHFHSNPNILQRCEHVEMAFKSRRDTVLMTSKRLVLVDYQVGMMLTRTEGIYIIINMYVRERHSC